VATRFLLCAMLHEYEAYSGPFHLPAVGCTAVMEAPIDWGSVEALPAPSERCEALAAPPYERQVARAIPQHPSHGHGTPLLSQLLQQEPGPPGPHQRRHRQVIRTRAGRPVPVFGMKESDGGTTMSMATVAVMALPAALSAAVPLEVAEVCTRKVNNAHCILTCV